jgi:hypothetical protein
MFDVSALFGAAGYESIGDVEMSGDMEIHHPFILLFTSRWFSAYSPEQHIKLER